MYSQLAAVFAILFRAIHSAPDARTLSSRQLKRKYGGRVTALWLSPFRPSFSLELFESPDKDSNLEFGLGSGVGRFCFHGSTSCQV